MLKSFILLLLINLLSMVVNAQKKQPIANVVEHVNAVTVLLNHFWSATFKRANLSYVPPTKVTPYSRIHQTACGKTLIDNAFYCPTDRSIWYDQNFLDDILSSKGRFALYTIVAHEFGHFISFELHENHIRSIEWELQADCLAGTFIRWLSDQSSADCTEFIQGAQTLLTMGDSVNTPWFVPNAHGQPSQRVRAFFQGFYQGHPACFNK